MATQLTQFEQFLTLFENLKSVAGEPKRLATFYAESSVISGAAERLQDFANDLRRRVFISGPKRFGQVPPQFEQAYREYETVWSPAISHAFLCDLFGMVVPYDPNDPYAAFKDAAIKDREPDEPNPEDDDNFHPELHDGGSALKLGINYWRSEYAAYSDQIRRGDNDDYVKLTAKKCRLALDAFDYLTRVIGVDIDDIFRRWREVPIIFMPSPVSNRHGEEKESLNDLLDNAVRAYVCGAPAAAIAMCRAVLEMVIRDHYLPDEQDRTYENIRGNKREKGLGDLILLAEKRYPSLRPLRLAGLKNTGDEILHRYNRREPLGAADEKAIIEYMRTLKTLVQKVER